jgi:hypothetical protein
MNAATAEASQATLERSPFYLWMAGIFVIVAFGGFTPTFWAKLATGTFHAPPIFYIHGLLLSTWTCFFFAQTALVASRRTLDHRAWGLAGIALFTALMCSILLMQLTVLHQAEVQGLGVAGRRFASVTLLGWVFMAVVFTLAIINIKKPEVHKRLMMVLMIGMMVPALARLFLLWFAPPGALGGGPPPVFVALPPAAVADLLLAAAIVRDWRTLGKPHPVYLYGGLALVLQQLSVVPIAKSGAWMSLAQAFQNLAG